MKRIQKQNILEQSIYWAIWAIIFLAPLLGSWLMGKDSNAQSISFRILGRTWLRILPFFIVFLINNYLLIPSLFLRKKYRSYTVLSVLLILMLCLLNMPLHIQLGNDLRGDKPLMEQKDDFRPDEDDMRVLRTNLNEGNGHPAPDVGGQVPNGNHPNMMMQKDRNCQPPFMDKGPHHHGPAIPSFDRLIVCLLWALIAIMMIAFNIAIKLLFQSFQNEEKMKELEKDRLSTELQYLKYQINPHFFMNTLNNIHALVDIDADMAKSSIIELSKLMRYVLYEANNHSISLSREIQFLGNYVELMKLRFTSKVLIEFDTPSLLPDIQIPPLLFICYLENAFKHGVSYQNESFIKIKISYDETEKRIIFFCQNSTFPKKENDQHHGIGLENTRKRLDLLYGDKYTLSVNDDKEKNIFEVLLLVPLLS